MTLNEAYGTVIYSIMLLAFVVWYLHCLYVIFFKCQRPLHYFSYENSELFVLVNVVGIISIAAHLIYHFTN